jgi:hypothetical protein
MRPTEAIGTFKIIHQSTVRVLVRWHLQRYSIRSESTLRNDCTLVSNRPSHWENRKATSCWRCYPASFQGQSVVTMLPGPQGVLGAAARIAGGIDVSTAERTQGRDPADVLGRSRPVETRLITRQDWNAPRCVGGELGFIERVAELDVVRARCHRVHAIRMTERNQFDMARYRTRSV